MLPEETPTPAFTSPAHQEGATPAPAADRLSIVEARLAEIRAQQSAGPAEPTPAAPALSDTPPAAAVPPGGGATQTEADPLLSEPGLAEALEHAPTAPASPTPTAPPEPATPEAAAATETAQHVSAEVAAEHLSAPQARAVGALWRGHDARRPRGSVRAYPPR